MSWSGRRVVVTGGAGFIGSHLARALAHRGAEVVVLDNFSTGKPSSLADVASRVEVFYASTLDTLRLAHAVRGADFVFHMAAVLGVKRTWEEPVRVIHENVTGTRNVLHAAAQAGVERVILASSSEVYGDALPPYSEEGTPAAPATGYAAAKLVEEHLAEAFTREAGLRTTCLRYFNVYGPGQASSAYGFVAAIFCDRVRRGLPPVVFGDGRQTRDFTHVDDTVEGTLRAAKVGQGHLVLNLGTGVETSVNDLARTVLVAAGRRDLEVEHAPARADEVRRRVADATRARRILGWSPAVRLEDGLKDVLVRSPHQVSVQA